MSTDEQRSAVGMAIQMPSSPKKVGQDQDRWDQQQDLPGEPQKECVFRLADRLKIVGTDDLKADDGEHASDRCEWRACPDPSAPHPCD